MDRIEIELGDGRKLVAYPYSDQEHFKEVWVDVENKDGSTIPIAVIGCTAELPIREFIARLWTGKNVSDGTDYDKEIHIESMEAEDEEG
ncbi:MAG: hypothetical protein II518_02690 [Candidatus Methanomethylophilus sp.]|jgi:hypothetical protein|nr:hypothetical protein [Methanomethylophilus sp.]